MVAKKKPTSRKKIIKKTAGKKTAAKKTIRKTTGAGGKKATKKTAKKVVKKTTKKTAGKATKKTTTATKVTKKAAKKKIKKTTKKPAMAAKLAKKTANQAITGASKPSMQKTAGAPASAKTSGKQTRAGVAAPQGTDQPVVKPYREQSGEDYMNAAQSAHFRHILNEWKKNLMAEVERTVHHMQDEASNFPDPNDRATQEEEFALELRTRDRERKLIKKINESLLDLDAGDYGYCEVCGVEIGVQRLEARPTATLCIDCKTLDEIKEKQLG